MPWLCMLCKMCDVRVCIGLVVKEKKELLTPDGLLEKEQIEWYQKELKEAEEDMVQAYLEKSKLEDEEVEIIKQRALKAQEEFEALE